MAKRAKHSNSVEDTSPRLQVIRTRKVNDISSNVHSKSTKWSEIDGIDRVNILLNYIYLNSLQMKFSQAIHLGLGIFKRDFMSKHLLVCNIHPERAFTSLFEWSSDENSVYYSKFWAKELVKFCSFITSEYTMDLDDQHYYDNLIARIKTTYEL